MAEPDAQADAQYLRGRVALLHQAQDEFAQLISRGCNYFRPYISCHEFQSSRHQSNFEAGVRDDEGLSEGEPDLVDAEVFDE